MSSPLNQHTVVGCVLAVLLSAGWSVPSLASNALPPPLLEVRTWPRMSVGAFGCYLEESLGHRDPRFNCALKHYENKGDPCKNTEAYYEGPDFPVGLASHVHPLATDVKLDWEHGELQSVTITLKGSWNEAQVRRMFKLPRAPAAQLTEAEEGRALAENLMDISVQYPEDPGNDAAGRRPSDLAHGSTEVTLIGFDHTGGGDADCGAE